MSTKVSPRADEPSCTWLHIRLLNHEPRLLTWMSTSSFLTFNSGISHAFHAEKVALIQFWARWNLSPKSILPLECGICIAWTAWSNSSRTVEFGSTFKWPPYHSNSETLIQSDIQHEGRKESSFALSSKARESCECMRFWRKRSLLRCSKSKIRYTHYTHDAV